MSKSKKENIVPDTYLKPKISWLLLIGEKYYRRLQPTPYRYVKIDLSHIKDAL